MTITGFARLFVAGVAACTVAAASAQVSKVGNGYLFRIRYTKGQKITYLMNMDSTAQGHKINVKMPMTQTIKSVNNKGVATVSVSMGNMTMTMDGKTNTRPMPGNMKEATMTVDSQGRAQGGGQQQTTIALPDKPVPIGGTWSANTTVQGGMGQPMQVSATYRLAGIERVGAFNAAKVTFTMKGTGQMAISGKGTVWLNVADGSMIKNTTGMTMTLGSMVMPMSMSITRK